MRRTRGRRVAGVGIERTNVTVVEAAEGERVVVVEGAVEVGRASERQTPRMQKEGHS